MGGGCTPAVRSILSNCRRDGNTSTEKSPCTRQSELEGWEHVTLQHKLLPQSCICRRMGVEHPAREGWDWFTNSTRHTCLSLTLQLVHHQHQSASINAGTAPTCAFSPCIVLKLEGDRKLSSQNLNCPPSLATASSQPSYADTTAKCSLPVAEPEAQNQVGGRYEGMGSGHGMVGSSHWMELNIGHGGYERWGEATSPLVGTVWVNGTVR